MGLRVTALLTTYNEHRFVGPCIEHLHAHGVDTYLIDNCSTDDTVEIAGRYEGRGLVGLERLDRDRDVFDLGAQLRHKEELAQRLDADWFIHLDADEIRLPPPGMGRLAEALATVDRDGYNAVNFLELSFIPTIEAPDHDHPGFRQTLRTYYPLLPELPHRLNAWKAADGVELAWKAGHRVRFPGLRPYPKSFLMKHYLFLSREHAREKFVRRSYPAAEVEAGWHRWRANLTEDDIRLPSAAELRVTRHDGDLDTTRPSRYHYLSDGWTSPV